MKKKTTCRPRAVILGGDALKVLRALPDESVQTCVTSPPYWCLRDYGTARWRGGSAACDHKPVFQARACRPKGLLVGSTTTVDAGTVAKGNCRRCGAVRVDEQLGLEATPEEYVGRMVEVFREVRRVLKDDGTLWLNLGDSYAATTKGSGGHNRKQDSNAGSWFSDRRQQIAPGLKPKDLVGIPWRVAFALQADGWYLRSDIIWHKNNPMPESVTDRPTKAHEYLFLLSKNARYYYDADAIREPLSAVWPQSKNTWAIRKAAGEPMRRGESPDSSHTTPGGLGCNTAGRNRRSVWTVSTKPFKGAHFATFPPKLIEPCVLAGSRPDDVVLDPFNGAGTSGLVALQHGRRYLGIELNPAYRRMTLARLNAAGAR